MMERINPFESLEVAQGYDAWFDTPLGRTVDVLEKDLLYRMARPLPGERVLDVGAGTGHFACDLARRGLRVTACEPSAAMLAVGRVKGCDVEWHQAPAERLPFDEGAFDLVFCVTALEFVEDVDAALREMVRVLAPGGRLVVGTLNAKGPWGRFYAQQARQEDSPFRHARFFTAKRLVKTLSPYGRVRWNSAVHLPPAGRHLEAALANAQAIEHRGRIRHRELGALLVGRIDV
ncbi:MAG: class I SAM-dependent methyltransferase [Anaerolineae bacterium]|jgi:ubiquinone/menaquinone biosynthesis C-methylase UbiE